TPYPAVYIRVNNLGFYVQDEFSVKPNLKITYGIRFDRNGNPNCKNNCFARFVSPFPALSKGTSIPYNQSIQTGLHEAFYSIESVAALPRLGITYNPKWSSRTVIRGGIGLFSNAAPGFLAVSVFTNAPNVFTSAVRLGMVNSGGVGSSPAIAIATGRAFQSSFASGATLAQLQAALAPVAFTPPPYYSVPSEVLYPKVVKFSLDIQHQFGSSNALTLGYAGNHGYDFFARNLNINGNYNPSIYPNGFGGLPATAPDPRFRVVTQLTNDGYSNYHGFSAEFRHRFAQGFQGALSYTWSHTLDAN